MGVPATNDYNQFLQFAKSTDTNNDFRISKMELFNAFKKSTKY